MQNELDTIGITLTVTFPPTDDDIMRSYWPDMWYTDHKDRRQIDENIFAKAFRDVNKLQYHNGLFYSREGRTTEESLLKDVWESLADAGIRQDVERIAKKMLGAVKLASTVPKFNINPNLIPLGNGDLYTNSWEFRADEFTASPYRLKAELPIELQNTPNFNKWLHDLFYDEDIGVIQEYLGYCLVPTTKAQKALFLVGEGGAGKSVLGVILESLLGDAMISTSNTQEFLQDKFKLPELEHKLVLYDDDLDNKALSSTGLYKKLITNTISITADRKYGQAFKFSPFAKIVACCNEMLNSQFDVTDGFYRRLLPILIKPISPDFKPDLHFYDKIRAERDGILQWAIVGLQRLIENGWVLSESKRTRDYLEQKKSVENHFPDFMESVFEFEKDAQVATTEILAAYNLWCRQNACKPLPEKVVNERLNDCCEKYGIRRDKNVPFGDKYVRGFRGLSIKSVWGSSGKIKLT